MKQHTTTIESQQSPWPDRNVFLDMLFVLVVNRLDLLFFAIVLLLANVHLLFGILPLHLSFIPDRVMAGEWWRVIAHPFAHVSWYHLLVDSSAFFLLYTMLDERRIAVKLLYVAASIVGAALMPLLIVPDTLGALGLCGLSGVAHGLMAIGCCELIGKESRLHRAVGIGALIILMAKSTIEAATGSVIFGSLHLGSVGVPIAITHAGGVLGGLIAFTVLRLCRRFVY